MFKKEYVRYKGRNVELVLHDNELRFIVFEYGKKRRVILIDNLLRQVIEGVEIYEEDVVDFAVHFLKYLKRAKPDIYEHNKLVIDTIIEHYV